MKELLQSLDWNAIITTLWTVILLPILTYITNEIRKYAKAKNVDKYTDILQNNVVNAVKDVYETIVKDIKGTEDWTEEKQAEVKEIAKQKAIMALSNSAYECLKEANGDFEDYLDSLVGTALFDVKIQK
jgi:replicative DNA helicase